MRLATNSIEVIELLITNSISIENVESIGNDDGQRLRVVGRK